MHACGLAVRLAFCCAIGVAAANAKVTFESLLREMTDLESLSRFPDPAYTVRQFSSYDRRSTDPAVLTDENWFANGDRGQHVRVEQRHGREEWVLMDAEGPGAIVRFWSANPADAGTVRIYLDNAEQPAIEMPLTEMLGGGQAPFLNPIAGERSRGWNSYLPIPYAKHCKVTASQRDFYYQINYRTYEKGTRVTAFPAKLTADAHRQLEATAARLARPSALSDLQGPGEQKSERVELGPEPFRIDLPVKRPHAIRRFTCRVDAADPSLALRGCLLEITFDGNGSPSIVAPLGDFFGTAPGANRYASLPSGALDDGTLYCHWVMPFRKSASLQFTNHTGRSMTLSTQITAMPYEWTRNSMYFHAGWRGEYPVKTRPRQDWNFLSLTGKGVFVGDMLHVTNPVKAWWGEGDEKIYVDGETFPSHFGTGSEDYFGYAWCCPEVFTHAYHNQPRCDGPGNYGHTCVSRFHVIDNIPFTKSFKFDMEVWHWAECEVALAATSYWYALPGASHPFKPIDAAQLAVLPPPPLPPPRTVAGALEGESLPILALTGGTTEKQPLAEEQWSGGAHLWWRDAQPGDTLTLAFPVEKPGVYRVNAAFTKAIDYGIVDLAINGRPVASGIDLFNDGVIVTPEQSLATLRLREGVNELQVRITGRNPKAIPRHMFGLDYLLVVPAE